MSNFESFGYKFIHDLADNDVFDVIEWYFLEFKPHPVKQ